MRLTELTISALVALAAAGCATMSAGSHVERGLDFRTYRTYDWGAPDELPTGDPRLDQNPFFKDHVQGEVEKALAGKGLQMSTTPDLRIHYHASITHRINVAGADQARGYCYTNNCKSEVSEYEAGTLVLDVVDVRRNVVIWRGWAQDAVGNTLDNEEAMARKIHEGVVRILAQFPVTR